MRSWLSATPGEGADLSVFVAAVCFAMLVFGTAGFFAAGFLVAILVASR
jgi:hypothetical protein